MNSIRFFGEDETRRLSSTVNLIDVADTAFRALSAGSVTAPARLILPLGDGNLFGVMPGAVANQKTFGAKLVSLTPTNPGRGLPLIQGFVVLFDGGTGAPEAMLEGATLTLLRTAAASASATRLLARQDSETMGIIGAGAQASAHIDAICSVRSIREVVVWSRDFERACDFAGREAHRTARQIRAVRSAQAAADHPVVCTVTSSKEPVLLGNWLAPGTHVNLVGAHSAITREIDGVGIAKAKLYVDSLENAMIEAGDILLPLQDGLIRESHIRGEIGQLLKSEIEGRQDSSEITIFKSLGHVAQDILCALALLNAARAAGSAQVK